MPFLHLLVLFTPNLLLYSLNGLPTTAAHIGEPCNILGLCWPLTLHIYCEKSTKTCQCMPDTPVPVGPHSCKRNKAFGDKCSTNDECLYSDNKSFCEFELGKCSCVQNYTYDTTEMKCVHETDHQKSFSSVFYRILSSGALWVILLLITLFVTIPCCLAFIYHCVCYDSSNDPGTMSAMRDPSISIRCPENGEENNRESFYELTSHDEPPPSYEEAIKNR